MNETTKKYNETNLQNKKHCSIKQKEIINTNNRYHKEQ